MKILALTMFALNIVMFLVASSLDDTNSMISFGVFSILFSMSIMYNELEEKIDGQNK